ncbi:SRPBCC family protein [Labrys monachus]|uniref:Carbon monoxide dehydrogenase subunit G n=1 Tax=Labrys monachus TaxID=217067 RepID=A0ABU0F8V8_9HYPH|nr:carbon monoxide dehydrogenase subunit G [Labrys monachus]MDQ0391024.1 carbon monoxide dehydrogenase subunit G [Labrys monachus]
MQMSDSQRIPASRDEVWAALNDPKVLKDCIPGCQSLEMTSPTEMVATVVIKIGPVKASFGGKVTLSDLDPPNGYRISGEGSGGVAGFAKGGATVRLEAESPDVTVLTYTVDAEIGGKLAQLGGRLIDATAKKLAAEFFSSFGRALGASAGGEAAPVPQKAGWLSRLAGTAGAVSLMLLLGSHWCCLGGHAHEPDLAALGHVCSSGAAARPGA